jgi:gentisate 1,2-dioxygenase
MISGGLAEAQNHILSPYRWVYIGTGFFVVNGEKIV